MKKRSDRALLAVVLLFAAVLMTIDAINISNAHDEAHGFRYYILTIAAAYGVSVLLFTINVATYKRR